MVDKLSEISGCLRLAYEVCKVIQTVNPLRPKSDEHQISPLNINAL